jgi:hypothetical protein
LPIRGARKRGARSRRCSSPDSAGHLRLPLSSSPEIFDNSPRSWLPPNSNYDQSLLRWLFGALARQANELGRVEESANGGTICSRASSHSTSMRRVAR